MFRCPGVDELNVTDDLDGREVPGASRQDGHGVNAARVAIHEAWALGPHGDGEGEKGLAAWSDLLRVDELPGWEEDEGGGAVEDGRVRPSTVHGVVGYVGRLSMPLEAGIVPHVLVERVVAA